MSVQPVHRRWTLDEFVAAWEAGRFDDQRVELIDGEVYPVVIGRWHGVTTVRVTRTLPNGRFEITSATLPAGDSLPDPDCWVLGPDAEPIASIGSRLSRWAPADVLLVVEVSDESLDMDLGRKALIYARSGYAQYWSVTPEGVYVHTEPTPNGYVRRVLHQRGEKVRVPYVDDVALDVTELIGPPQA
ncbi:MAG: Uma2 family endonuclease [Pseudonocardia sp.]